MRVCSRTRPRPATRKGIVYASSRTAVSIQVKLRTPPTSTEHSIRPTVVRIVASGVVATTDASYTTPDVSGLIGSSVTGEILSAGIGALPVMLFHAAAEASSALIPLDQHEQHATAFEKRLEEILTDMRPETP